MARALGVSAGSPNMHWGYRRSQATRSLQTKWPWEQMMTGNFAVFGE